MFLAAVEVGHWLDTLWAKLAFWTTTFVSMIPNLLLAAVIVAVGVVISGVVARFLTKLLTKATHNDPLSRLIAALLRVALIALSMLGALSLLHLDKTVTSLLAGVGVIGLALGFAFQDIAANFMAGFIMAAQRPFAPGDTVELAGKKCKVVSVQLRATLAETLDGLSILVPNKDVFQKPIINFSRTTSRRMELKIGIDYKDDLEKVRKVVLDAVSGIVHRDDKRKPELFYTGFGDSSIDAQLRVWLVAPSELALIEARSEAIMNIKRAFDAAGIALPAPITLDSGGQIVPQKKIEDLKAAARVSQAS